MSPEFKVGAVAADFDNDGQAAPLETWWTRRDSMTAKATSWLLEVTRPEARIGGWSHQSTGGESAFANALLAGFVFHPLSCFAPFQHLTLASDSGGNAVRVRAAPLHLRRIHALPRLLAATPQSPGVDLGSQCAGLPSHESRDARAHELTMLFGNDVCLDSYGPKKRSPSK